MICPGQVRPVPPLRQPVSGGTIGSMDDATLLDRFRGCLVGLAVGDVLGCPYENLDWPEIRSLYALPDGQERLEGLPEWPAHRAPIAKKWRLRGLHSDDTQQALTVARVLLRDGELRPAALLRELLWLYRQDVPRVDAKKGLGQAGDGAHRGAGRTLRRTMQRAGHPPDDPPSPSDGAAMRVAPVGLFFRDDADARVAAAGESALVTHRHPHAVAAAAAVAGAVAAALDGADYEALLNRAARGRALRGSLPVRGPTPRRRARIRHSHCIAVEIGVRRRGIRGGARGSAQADSGAD